MLPSQARKKRKPSDFSLVPALSLAYDPAVRYIFSAERKTDESLRRNIIMAKSARSTRNCSVAPGAGAIPRNDAQTGRQPNRCTIYRVPDSYSSPTKDDFAPQSRAERDRSGRAGMGSI